MTGELIDHGSEEWAAARKRIVDRRDFGSHLVGYLVVNAFLVGIWLLGGGGYFWPAWIMGGWGIGLVMHAWELYGKREVTDADVEAELRRRHHR
ncbi:MAG TPA: 2TM domain-containing protein [Acidimicrobiales bacterium]|nr:2TM domain-containing protein [Acidimicrobiales bacterium]